MTADGKNTADEWEDAHFSLAFSGKVTASVTHELNNVLGTIGQVNGLIEDLIEFGTADPDTLSSKLQDVSGRIVKQIERGSQLIERLNTFAHMSDHEVEMTEVVGLCENMTALMQRLAGLRKVTLKASLPGEAVTIITNPFLFAQLYFAVIFAALGIAERDSTINVRLTKHGDGALIEVSAMCDESAGRISDGTTEIGMLGERLSATIEDSRDGGSETIRVTFPEAI